MEGIHDTMLEEEPLSPELGVTEPMSRFQYEGKAEAMKVFEDLRSLNNSLIMCAFTTDMVGKDYSFDKVGEMLEAVTGRSFSSEGMLKIGERNYLLLRILAGRAGYSADKDYLPDRLKEPLSSGATEGEDFPEERLEEILEEYYEIRGYDQSGLPGEDKLKELGLEKLDC